MKTKYKLFFNLMVILGICFSLFGVSTQPVKAGYTCIWNGLLNIDWTIPTNWSDCNNSVPTATDDVIIPAVTTNNPTIPRNIDVVGPSANSITIQSGAKLTIMGGMAVYSPRWDNYGTLDASMLPDYDIISIMGVFGSNNLGEFINHEGGTVNVIGSGGERYLIIYLPFTNNGLVDLQSANLGLGRGGTHTGTFQGNNGTVLHLGYEVNQTFNFEPDSEIKIPNLFLHDGTANIKGTYWPQIAGNSLNVQPSSQPSTLKFATGANIVAMPEYTNVSNWGKIIFESATMYPHLTKLNLDSGGEVNNFGEISISDRFYWYGGKLSGTGSTEVLSGATFTINTSSHELYDQTLVNSSTANWNAGGISLANAAIFQNDSIFNANASTTMGGGLNGSFINNGSFFKYGADTTTIMDIDFTNNGNMDVIAGTLTFPSGITSGDGTTIDLGGGTLNSGDSLTLVSGNSLVGSGTLSSNLINGGEVSPGSSPGLITVGGDYSQSTDGILTIELGGTTAGSGYDQLAVIGNASLEGILDVTLIDAFTPSGGDSFTILTYASHTGIFTSVNLPLLPDGMEWNIDYGSNAIILTVQEATSFQIFLPLIIR
jgi:hypothetical protein